MKKKIELLKHLLSISLLFVAIVCACPSYGNTQADTSLQKASAVIDRLSGKTLNSLEDKYRNLQQQVASYSERSLKQMQRREQKLRKKLSAKDSLAAKKIFSTSGEQYAEALLKMKSPVLNVNGRFSEELPAGTGQPANHFQFPG